MSTLSEKSIANKIAIETELNQTTPGIPGAFNDVIADILAIAQQSIEKAISLAELENLVKTATLRENGGKLNDIGEEVGINYRNATASVLTVQIVAVDGTEITPQYSLSGDSNGLDYTLSSNSIASGGFLTFQVTCATTGPDGNLIAGQDSLTLSAPLSGAEPSASVVSVDDSGSSAEGLDSYRQRILDELRNPGEAGNLGFYRKRGKNAAGVNEIFPYRGYLVNMVFTNPGDITCFVEATEEQDPDGVPTQAIIDAAEEAIQYDADDTLQEIDKLPTTVRVLHMEPIMRDGVYFVISGLSTFDSGDLAACKSDIEDALDDSLRLMAPFISGLDFSKDKNDVLSVPYFSSIVDNVVRTYSGSYSGLLFGFSSGLEGTEPAILEPGQLVKLGGPPEYV